MISSSNTLKKILWIKMYTALNFFLILSTLILAPKAYSSCVVAIPDDCPTGKVCPKFNEKGEGLTNRKKVE